MSEPEPIYELRTHAGMYALIGGICGAVFVMGIVVAIAKEPSLWPPTLGVGLILAAFFSWFATTRLTLTEGSLQYRSLLSRTDVALANVIRARFESGFIAFSSKPFFRIIITVREGTGKKDIILNGGLFERKEIDRWVHTVNSRPS